MLTKIRRLFQILGRWKIHYLMAGVFLVVALFVRSLEPKILQIVADNVITFFQSNGEQGQFSGDFVSRLFHRILPEIKRDNLGRILVCLAGIYMFLSLLRGGLLVSSSSLTAASTEKAIKGLRDTLFSHIQRLPMRYFARTSKGELLQRSTGDVDTVRRFLLSQVVDIVRMVAIFVFSFAMMYIVHPVYALISVMFAPLLICSSYLFFKKENQVWEEHEAEADKLSTIVQENLNGIRVVKAFANEKFEMEKFDNQNRRKRKIGLKQVRLHTYFWPLSDFLVHLQITISIIVGGYFTVTNQISVGEFLSFYSYMRMVAWPMRQVGKLLSKLGIAAVATGRIYEILDAKEEKQDGETKVGPIRGEIEFRHVTFKYDPASPEHALNDISFTIHAGEKVAIIGPTGSGKSTIINLLIGLYDVDEGEILLDGVDVRNISKRFLRERIGVVLQTPFLFSTTVKDNIAYAAPGTDDSDVMEAAKIAQVHEIENVLSHGYDTLVGEKGVTLSGGQKQRVALARTVLTEPDILVLDDITSAVDTETERAIFDALETPMGGRTTIIISHRITSIQQADRILVISKGRLVQQGSHLELSQMADGYYKEIHNLQSALEREIEYDR